MLIKLINVILHLLTREIHQAEPTARYGKQYHPLYRPCNDVYVLAIDIIITHVTMATSNPTLIGICVYFAQNIIL